MADKNMNTRRLLHYYAVKNKITNKKYLIYTAKRTYNKMEKI